MSLGHRGVRFGVKGPWTLSHWHGNSSKFDWLSGYNVSHYSLAILFMGSASDKGLNTLKF